MQETRLVVAPTRGIVTKITVRGSTTNTTTTITVIKPTQTVMDRRYFCEDRSLEYFLSYSREREFTRLPNRDNVHDDG